MGNNHLQIRKVHRDIFELERQPPVELGPAGEGCALVPHDWELKLLRPFEQWPVCAVLRVEVLVDGSELQTFEAEIGDAIVKLFQVVWLASDRPMPSPQACLDAA